MVVAPKPQYQVERLPEPRREGKPRAKAKPRPRANIARMIKSVILVALGFAMAFLVVSRHAIIAENHQQILELEAKLEKALKQTELLKLELAASDDLRKIEEIAKNQLNMGYPDQTQVLYVELPDDEVEQEQTEIATHRQMDIWDIIMRLID